MKNILITGGTGFLGSNLAIALVKEGYKVRILRRLESDLRAIGDTDVEHCFGDVRDIASIRRAIKGCDTIFHTAGCISYWRKERQMMMDVNVAGTRNMVNACMEVDVEKFVYTSSVGAIGFRTDGKLADEQNEFNWGAYDVGYNISKYHAEQEVLRGVNSGLPAVIVNPSAIIGPRDLHFRSGQILRDVYRKRIFYYTGGSMNVVSVDDVVRGHLQAARRGRIGQRYILGGENLTIREIMEITAETIGGIKPLFKLSNGTVKVLGVIFESFGNLFNVKPLMTRELAAGVGIQMQFTSEKAQRELEYSIAPFQEGLQNAFSWYKEHRML